MRAIAGRRTHPKHVAPARTPQPIQSFRAPATALAASKRAFTPAGRTSPRLPPKARHLCILDLGRQVQPVARASERDIQQALGLFAILRLRVFVGFRLEIADAQPCLPALGVGDDANRTAARRRSPG